MLSIAPCSVWDIIAEDISGLVFARRLEIGHWFSGGEGTRDIQQVYKKIWGVYVACPPDREACQNAFEGSSFRFAWWFSAMT
jgi:hypothetical protein